MSGKVSKDLNKGIETFLETSAGMTEHIVDKDNPHEVTKAQIGLDKVTNVYQASNVDLTAHKINQSNPHNVTKVQVGLGNVLNEEQATVSSLTEHATNQSNPHGVTKAQVGLMSVTDDKQATKAEFDSHATSKANPHTVTKAQIGLTNVTDDKQTTKAEYDAHVGGTVDKHTAEDIIYNEENSVYDFVNALVISSGAGTFNHALLNNRDVADAHPTSAITGLSRAINKDTYTFKGITLNTVETELLTDDVGSYIGSRKIFIPATRVAFIEVTAFLGAISTTRWQTVSYKKYHGFLCSNTTGKQMELEQVSSIGSTTSSVISDLRFVQDGTKFKLMVTSGGTPSNNWKVIVRVTAVDVGEF